MDPIARDPHPVAGLSRLLPGLCLLLLGAAACPGPSSRARSITAVTPATHSGFPIVSGAHAASCNTCHGDYASFTQFTCLNCHAHDQGLTDELHRSVVPAATGGTMAAGGYSYTGSSCLQCHATGARMPFDHLGITSSCASCHDTGATFAALPTAGKGLDGGTFAHPDRGGNDCRACHTTASWFGAASAPNGAHDPANDLTVTALVPTYAGTSISQLTPQDQTLPMPMDHRSASLPPAALTTCVNCHADANAGVYFPGQLHASLTALNLAQPTQCLDCHAASMPRGFVGPTAANPARTPPGGEMKHDAVLWSNGAPTAAAAVPQNCALCHQSPPAAPTWTTTQAFHASLAAAGQAQPASCLDCHANSRPAALLSSANAALPAGVTFDHGAGAALGDCASCHVSGSATQYTSWSGGLQHPAGSPTPATCLPCHAGERPASTAGWNNASYTASPFDYGTNPAGVTHGAGQDCVACHANPGTGTWGGTPRQNWSAGHFTHGPSTLSGSTCIACHTAQRPDLVLGAPAAATALGFDHSINGTGDCLGCHQATVTAGLYVRYSDPATNTLPGGDWKGGIQYPGSFLVSSQAHVTVTETTLNRSGLNNLVTSTSSVSATLYNPMLHVAAAVPPELNAGPSSAPDYSKCWHCHTNTGGTVTSYSNGVFHASLDSYSATPGGAITPLPQPTSQCMDCHLRMRPVGIVETGTARLQPMDHDASFTAAVTLSGNTVTGAGQIDCSTCHRNPGVSWADGAFHRRTGAAVPQDCTVCHYSLMADAPSADLTSGTTYAMRHRSVQVTFQNCGACHTGALAKGSTTPLAAALWQPGAFHASLPAQPAACLDCHAVSTPAAATQSSFSYTLAAGGTASNQGQWMNHGSTSVTGLDCFACHAADAKASGSAWNKADSYHAAVAAPARCADCHGTANGRGTVAGTNNNLPVGLTNSSTMTTASNDPSTGIAPGTLDQITHADVNASAHDCNFCHTQAGRSSAAGVQGKEWAQASFHASFNSANPLVSNGTTGRCSNCHMNVRPGATFTGQDHSSFTASTTTQDCATCHSWPGTGTTAAPNWLGASGVPQYISVGGFTVPQPPAASPVTQGGIANLPHPTVATGVSCTTCHATSSGGKNAIGYDHASALINTNCNSCHEAGSNLVGTPWNRTTIEAAGAGDTRPFTLTSIYVAYSGNSLTVTWPNHFYNSGTTSAPRIVDCKECHLIPAGNGATTTGAAYLSIGSGGLSSTGAWRFPHTKSKMTDPSTCTMCHGSNIPR